jgi:hypothetical protein
VAAAVLARRFGTGDLWDAIRQAGDAAVIKPKPLTLAVEGGFTLNDFTVSEEDRTVTCPNGVTPRITARRNVTFGAACRGCPLRGRCTTSKAGRALIWHQHDDLLRAAGRDWPGLREDYSKYRPNVERDRRPGCHRPRPPGRAPLPGTNQEQRLAQAAHRRAEPAQGRRGRRAGGLAVAVLLGFLPQAHHPSDGALQLIKASSETRKPPTRRAESACQ